MGLGGPAGPEGRGRGAWARRGPVSYTHLDVYKRQPQAPLGPPGPRLSLIHI
ncbi:hypothetical protein [Streptomyces fragilis]|uniref:hypothetical protein n=1 Tax=Streptomyces fragilis TaxID=67301 RepID=UPI0024DE9FA7|nr:hypothetical protein [Streptomyces fragilis]